ncbi:hypothetical protein K445DRAFT_120947 [Daldinia sp. EC12]|nr:hypothetical protein K445DRAFT_120947 [Daldinia sp. EC12]
MEFEENGYAQTLQGNKSQARKNSKEEWEEKKEVVRAGNSQRITSLHPSTAPSVIYFLANCEYFFLNFFLLSTFLRVFPPCLLAKPTHPLSIPNWSDFFNNTYLNTLVATFRYLSSLSTLFHRPDPRSWIDLSRTWRSPHLSTYFDMLGKQQKKKKKKKKSSSPPSSNSFHTSDFRMDIFYLFTYFFQLLYEQRIDFYSCRF